MSSLPSVSRRQLRFGLVKILLKSYFKGNTFEDIIVIYKCQVVMLT